MRPSREPPLYPGTRTGEPLHESDAATSSWIAIEPLSRQVPAGETIQHVFLIVSCSHLVYF